MVARPKSSRLNSRRISTELPFLLLSSHSVLRELLAPFLSTVLIYPHTTIFHHGLRLYMCGPMLAAWVSEPR